MQWNSPKNTAKTGGTAGWTPQPMAATTGAGYRPMVSPTHSSNEFSFDKTGQFTFLLIKHVFILDVNIFIININGTS